MADVADLPYSLSAILLDGRPLDCMKVTRPSGGIRTYEHLTMLLI